MMKLTALVIAGMACATAPAQVNAGIGSPVTVTGALERGVTGAPFSAESVTEFLQTASDGSHVKQSHTHTVARDSSGRTTYSQSLLPLLPGGPGVLTVIRDPVAGVRYLIDPQRKVARRELIRTPPAFVRVPSEDGRYRTRGRGDTARDAQPDLPQEAALMAARQSVARVLSARGGEDLARNTRPDTAALGERTIEGVTAAGVRVTAVIPAGQIGNEKPLTVMSEAWYSPELSIVVMSKVHDPLLGDTTFQLTHLRRAEPSSSLFEVPEGYRVAGPGIPLEPAFRRAKD